MSNQLNINTTNGVPFKISSVAQGGNKLIQFVDSNSKALCAVRGMYEASGNRQAGMFVYDNAGTLKGGLFVNYDGTTLTATAPSPAAADNSTKIATTAWVRTLVNSIVFQRYYSGDSAPASSLGNDGDLYLKV